MDDTTKLFKSLRVNVNNLTDKIQRIEKILMAKRNVSSKSTMEMTEGQNHDQISPRNEEDLDADKHEWDAFVKNHSHVVDGESEASVVVNSKSGGVNTEESPSMKFSMSHDISIRVYEIDTTDIDEEECDKKINFRPLVNEEKVKNSNFVLPRDAIDKVKSKFENSLVYYFIGNSLAFQIVQNYVMNTWSKFGFEKVMNNDDGIFLFKFADSTGTEQVLDRGPWLIRNKWTPSLPLKKDVVSTVPIWVKMHKVPPVAYSKDGLSLIATQIGKPVMLDSYTICMCGDAWGRIIFARALIEVSSDSDLKKEVIMAVPNEDETTYTREVISVESEWQPRRYADCKKFGHSFDRCPKTIKDHVVSINKDSDGFMEVKKKKHKDGRTDFQPRSRQFKGTRLVNPNPNLQWQKKGTTMRGAEKDSMVKNKVNGPSTSNSFDVLNTLDVEDKCGTSGSKSNIAEEQEAIPKVSQLNEHVESEDEVDEFIFPEGDKFDIRLKGRVRI
ncbi:reverse transcriptase domain-containing protein [Tanacetum coccineum]|uniref:Reverse transcriptase domain-containing protein n=1 Tax=Tanacetum coccineum TaxID=301880 RepID=A0ABQ5D9D9_9ASTR